MKCDALIISLFWCLLLGLTVVPDVPAAVSEAPEISIEGVSGEELENVAGVLRLPSGLVRDGRINELWLNRFVRLAPSRAARALEPFGYYAPEIRVDLDRDREPILIRVSIETGEPVRVATRHLDVDGQSHPLIRKRLEDFPLAPGSVLRHQAYEAAKAELQALAVDLGFLDATFTTHRIRVDPEQKTADIDLVLQTGERFRFGELRLIGGDDYPDRFLRRYLTVEPGDYFSFSELGRTQQKFLDSDRFSQVLFVPLREQEEGGRIPVEIKLEAKAPKRLRPGIGYGTDTGSRFFLRYQDVNMWHLGHEFNTDLLIAEMKQNLRANYLIPGYRNIDTLLALRGGYEAEDLDTYETRYVFAEIEQLYGFAEKKVGSVFVRFQRETSNISGDKNTSLLLMPGLRFRVSRLNDAVRPRKGYFLSAEVRGVWEALGSDHSLVQTLGEASLIQPLPWRMFLHLRGKAATTIQKDEFADLPASLRFFAGGDNSVRGYAYQSLGPTNALGEVIGGKHLLVGSVELERRFLKNWSAAVFYDAGNAFNNLDDYDLAEAVGAGLRYFTPVGPVRVDVARPFGADKSSYRLHIGLGVAW